MATFRLFLVWSLSIGLIKAFVPTVNHPHYPTFSRSFSSTSDSALERNPYTPPQANPQSEEPISASSSSSSSSYETTTQTLARRWRKSTKQIATLGPASDSMIEELFLSGTDVFRLNFSHGTREEKDDLVNQIREVERKYNHPIGVLGDLQGPKIRTGVFEREEGFELVSMLEDFFRDETKRSLKGYDRRTFLLH